MTKLPFDPETHRAPTERDTFSDWYPEVGQRVALMGTDVYGTILRENALGSNENPVYVEWDTPTDNGMEEWIGLEHLVLVGVRGS